ncbi:hypothetical protein ABT104_13505, partial [Streptomyces mobaraensis]
IERNADAVHYAASTMKVAVLAALHRPGAGAYGRRGHAPAAGHGTDPKEPVSNRQPYSGWSTCSGV